MTVLKTKSSKVPLKIGKRIAFLHSDSTTELKVGEIGQIDSYT